MPFMMETAIDPAGNLDVAMALVVSVIGLCLESMVYTKLYQVSVKWYGKRWVVSGRAEKIVALIWSGAFVLVGLAVMIPVLGGFGVVWTLAAGLLAAAHAWQLVNGYRRKGPVEASPEVQRQLEQLETLRAAGLLSGEEYREKRRRILEEP